MTKALIIIDIQNDYFPGGKMELVGAVQAADNASKIQRHFRQNALPVIHIRHIALSPTATFFLPETHGSEINQSVAPSAAEPVVIKHFPNSFRETELQSILAGLDATELVVVGMMTHMCVDTTVRAANDAGYKVTLIGDACATKNLEFGGVEVTAANTQVAYLAAIDGSFAAVMSTSEYLGE